MKHLASLLVHNKTFLSFGFYFFVGDVKSGVCLGLYDWGHWGLGSCLHKVVSGKMFHSCDFSTLLILHCVMVLAFAGDVWLVFEWVGFNLMQRSQQY